MVIVSTVTPLNCWAALLITGECDWTHLVPSIHLFPITTDHLDEILVLEPLSHVRIYRPIYIDTVARVGWTHTVPWGRGVCVPIPI